MAEEHTDVFVGGYPDIDAASTDFDALAEHVKDKKLEIQAAILITHDKDGTVNVRQTADHRGRTGVEWGSPPTQSVGARTSAATSKLDHLAFVRGEYGGCVKARGKLAWVSFLSPDRSAVHALVGQLELLRLPERQRPDNSCRAGERYPARDEVKRCSQP